LAGFITTTSGFRFSVYTRPCLRAMVWSFVS
jgi:hypothetical protein